MFIRQLSHILIVNFFLFPPLDSIYLYSWLYNTCFFHHHPFTCPCCHTLHFPSLLAFSASLVVQLPRHFSNVSTSLLLHSQHTLVKATIIFLLDHYSCLLVSLLLFLDLLISTAFSKYKLCKLSCGQTFSRFHCSWIKL